MKTRKVSGDVEIDGAYFGGYVKPANRREDRKDRRLFENRSGKRQVVVFTHDLIFFNDLCHAAEDNVDVKTIALFSDGASAGQIDPAGLPGRACR